MLKLHAIQAEFGDALLLEYGTASRPRFILVDGGPEDVFDDHVKPVLRSRAGGALELVVVSHVDDDHAVGVVDLLADLDRAAVQGKDPLVAVKGIWLNAFSRTLGPDLLGRLTSAVDTSPSRAAILSAVPVLAAIGHGSGIAGWADRLHIGLNVGFPGQIVTAGAAVPFASPHLKLEVLGPSQENLAALQEAWEAWLEKNEEEIASGEIEVTAMADDTPTNLGSITLLAQTTGKKPRRLLLAGDARGDHLRDALEDAGYLRDGRAHVDVFKLPHHGSDRNVTREFLEQVTADHYVVSANGKHGNPDPSTLRWILEAAREQGRTFTLHATNRTKSIDAFEKKYPPRENGWTLRVLGKGKHSLEVVVAE